MLYRERILHILLGSLINILQCSVSQFKLTTKLPTHYYHLPYYINNSFRKMNKPLFGTSGVRGVVNQDLTPELCKNVSKALGTILPQGSAVCVGTDSRLSRELIKDAVTE